MEEITCNLTKSLAVLSENGRGYAKGANFVLWNGKKAKLDIYEWPPGHERFGKGISPNENEGRKLYEVLKQIYEK